MVKTDTSSCMSRNGKPPERILGPLVLAVILHVAFLTGSLTLPDFFRNRKPLEEVYTIDLVALPEIKVAPSPPKPEATPAPKKVAPPREAPAEKVGVDIAENPPPAEAEPAVPAKPVSLKPIKKKKRKAKDLRLAEERERERRLREKKLAERKKARERRRKELARIRRQEMQARRAALEATRNLIRESETTTAAAAPRTGGRSEGKKLNNIILQQYLSGLFERVHRHWILPEMRKWDASLETVVVLTIRRDGTVVDLLFEKKSEDPFFDQFVKKTIEEAAPMPRFSKLMKQEQIEVGLRFRPGELSL